MVNAATLAAMAGMCLVFASFVAFAGYQIIALRRRVGHLEDIERQRMRRREE